MYMTEFILEKIGVTGAYKVLYYIMNGDIPYINESLQDLDANRVINTLITLEYDNPSILDLILRFINQEEAL